MKHSQIKTKNKSCNSLVWLGQPPRLRTNKHV